MKFTCKRCGVFAYDLEWFLRHLFKHEEKLEVEIVSNQ